MTEQLNTPTQAFINGKYVDAANGQTLDSFNPATGEILASVADGGEADVAEAVRAARAAAPIPTAKPPAIATGGTLSAIVATLRDACGPRSWTNAGRDSLVNTASWGRLTWRRFASS